MVENPEQSAPNMQVSARMISLLWTSIVQYSLPNLQSSLIFHCDFSHAVAAAVGILPSVALFALALPFRILI